TGNATDARGNPIVSPAPLFTWASDATLAVTVTTAGVAKAVGEGSANVSASSGGKSGSIALTVDAIASVSVSPASTSVGVGATTTFTAAPKDSNNVTVPNGGAASWDTGNHAIATINSSGVATGVSA